MEYCKYIIGIDPGINGGIVVLNRDQCIVDKLIMPIFGKGKKEYDILSICSFLNKYSKGVALLERQQPQFKDGKVQLFKTGFGFGMLEGLLTALKISYQIIAPKIWQKNIFEGLSTADTKTSSIMFCKRKWPKESWLATIRCKKCHDGLTDAACIAYYGIKINSLIFYGDNSNE